MKQVYVIKYREGIKEGEIFGISFERQTLIKAIASNERQNGDYFKNHSDEQIWECVERSGEFEMITAVFYDN